MSDIIYKSADFLKADDILGFIEGNLAIDAQCHMDTWTREQMQDNVNKRSALIAARRIVLDTGEKILREGK